MTKRKPTEKKFSTKDSAPPFIYAPSKDLLESEVAIIATTLYHLISDSPRETEPSNWWRSGLDLE